MRDRDEFESCMELVRAENWWWFITLKFQREVSPKYRANRYESPEDAFKVWLEEANDEFGMGRIQFVRVIEKGETGDILFHLLVKGIFENRLRFWQYRWWQLTSGAAWNRQLDDRIQGLIRFFFYKKKCDVEFSLGSTEAFCEADTQGGSSWER
jgi:hypothetical protein